MFNVGTGWPWPFPVAFAPFCALNLGTFASMP